MYTHIHTHTSITTLINVTAYNIGGRDGHASPPQSQDRHIFKCHATNRGATPFEQVWAT